MFINLCTVQYSFSNGRSL